MIAAGRNRAYSQKAMVKLLDLAVGAQALAMRLTLLHDFQQGIV